MGEARQRGTYEKKEQTLRGDLYRDLDAVIMDRHLPFVANIAELAAKTQALERELAIRFGDGAIKKVREIAETTMQSHSDIINDLCSLYDNGAHE